MQILKSTNQQTTDMENTAFGLRPTPGLLGMKRPRISPLNSY